MKKLMIFAASAVFALGLIATPASAGWQEECGAKVKELEMTVDSLAQNKPNLDKLKDYLRKAKQGIEQGKKKKCFKLAGKAEDLLQRMGE